MSSFKGCMFVLGAMVCGAASAEGIPAQQTPAKKPVAEIIPTTAHNWRGHQSLYREGWRMVSSSEKAFSYAREHAIVSSGQAMSQVITDARRHSAEYGSGLKEAGKSGVQTGAAVLKGGTEISEAALAMTGGAVKSEFDYGSSNLKLAWERFYQGNMTLVQRTEEDRRALASVPGDWYKNVRGDFSNLHELTDTAKNSLSVHIEGDWGRAYGEARADFDAAYRQSGTRSNALSGLGDIMAGWVEVLYSGLVKPAARSAVHGAETGAKVAAQVIFLPVSGVFIVSGRTIESTGLGLYYTTSMGVSLVSPTVEGGLLTGLSMLSLGSIPPTAAIGGGAGLVNEVAVVAVAAPAAGTAVAVGAGAADSAIYATQVSYDLVKGTTRVAMNVTESGIVLGYNALTALPTQAVLGVPNAAIFLVYDGPRLVVASVEGKVQWSGKNGETGSVPVQSLPVGSVVDLKALGKEPGVQVQVITDDPEVVQKVLDKLPEDLREGGKP